jgi:hypothetical protein
MATLGGKQQIVTFKAEEALVEAMEDIPNRSEFIRSAILAALDGVCPLCHGTGVLNTHQQTNATRASSSASRTEADRRIRCEVATPCSSGF